MAEHSYRVEWKLASGRTSQSTFTAPDDYTARTLALAEQAARDASDDPVESAQIRRNAGLFTGPWFDLNEEAP